MKNKVTRAMGREAIGWISIASCIIMFPVLFYLCVFFPIWMGWTTPFP